MTNSDSNNVRTYIIKKFRADIDRVKKLFYESGIHNDFSFVWNHVINLWRTSYSEELKHIPFTVLDSRSYNEFYGYCNHYMQ